MLELEQGPRSRLRALVPKKLASHRPDDPAPMDVYLAMRVRRLWFPILFLELTGSWRVKQGMQMQSLDAIAMVERHWRHLEKTRQGDESHRLQNSPKAG